MHRRLLLTLVCVGVALSFASAAWAQAPGDAPPVRQEIGFMDGLIAIQQEADCRICHGSVVDRHHLLTAGTQIPANSVVPYPDADGDGVDDMFYGCSNCHQYVGTWPNGSMVIVRDCTACHNQDSPHHRTQQATDRQCNYCHGVVDNYDDGHYIPAYDPSLVTPARSLTDAGYYPDGSPEMENQGTGTVDTPEGLYPGDATTGLVLESTGQDNDILIDHTSHSSTASFNVEVVHQLGIDPPTCSWSDDGSDAGKLTITFDTGVTIANDVITAINDEMDAVTEDNLTASPSSTQGEGTVLFPDSHYNPKGGDPLNNRGFGAGGCNYCHDADGLDIILNNHDNHHGINLGIGTGSDVKAGTPDDPNPGTTWRKCNCCHDYTDRDPHLGGLDYATYHDAGGIGFQLAIRICEECHSVESLHNIQADSDGDGVITVGGELSGYGHIGKDGMVEDPPGSGTYRKDSDCWGCHGFAVPEGAMAAASLAPGSSAVIPTLYNLDNTSITAGTDATIVLSGVGFTNVTGNTTFESDVLLTAADGSSVTLTPDAVSEGTVAVTIPGSTAPGNYKVSAVKGTQASNPMSLTVVPEVSIASAVSDGTVTIAGSGFGKYAGSSETSVTGDMTFGWGRWKQSASVPGSIVSWNDTEIVVDFGATPVKDLTVNSVFGAASANVKKAKGGNGNGKGKGFGNGFNFDFGNGFGFGGEKGFGFGR